MIGTAASRRRRSRRARNALKAVAFAWLTVMLQPCVMALTAEHECPHCPPKSSEQRPCHEVDQPDCRFDEQTELDSRLAKLQVKDQPLELPDLVVHRFAAAALTVRGEPGHPGSTDPPYPISCGPPRNVLFCVYLK